MEAQANLQGGGPLIFNRHLLPGGCMRSMRVYAEIER
jgi:hypothetical protein